MREHGVVEVEATEALESLGGTEQLAGAVAAAHDRDVERATTEVVDRDDVAGLHPSEVHVVRARPPRVR